MKYTVNVNIVDGEYVVRVKDSLPHGVQYVTGPSKELTPALNRVKDWIFQHVTYTHPKVTEKIRRNAQ